MRFKLQGDNQTTYTSMAALASAELHDTLLATGNQQKTYTIEWNWPYQTPGDGNTLETSKDMAALKLTNVGFKIEVVGEQAE